MSSAKHGLLKFLGILFFLACLGGVSLHLFMPKAVFVLDDLYEDTVWAKNETSVRWVLFKQGLWVQTKTIDLGKPEQTLYSLPKNTELMVFSPLSSALLSKQNLSLKDFFPQNQPLLLGMGPLARNAGLFDFILIVQEGEGWDEAALYLKKKSADTPLMTALLTTLESRAGKIFEETFDNEHLLVIEQSSSAQTEVYAQSIVKTMQAQSVLQVVAPELQNPSVFFSSDDTLSWVVDIRFADLVPKNQLLLAVGDDLPRSLQPIFPFLDAFPSMRGIGTELPLLRTCFPMSGMIGNLFASAKQGILRLLL